MLNPKVSVVIPAYNAMTFLPETLASVLNQTFSDFEVLIINDGSQDNVEQWANEVTDERVKLISQANQGLAGARNTGILKSRGKYIAFLDADDVWDAAKLEKQVNRFEQNPKLGVVDTHVFFVDEQGNKLFPAGASYPEGSLLERQIVTNLVLCGSSAMVRRECFETVGLFNTSLRACEDWEMWARIAFNYPFSIIEEPLVYYRQHPNNMSKDVELMFANAREAIESIYQTIPLPSELKKLKRLAYRSSSYYLATKAYGNGNYSQAISLCTKVLYYDPWQCFSRDFIYLLSKSVLQSTLGSQGYEKLINLISLLKSRKLFTS